MGRFVRSVLLMPLTADGARLIDLVVVPISAIVALVVGLPIVALTTVLGAGVAIGLQELGAPDAVTAIPTLLGFIGGLALGFIVLLRLYRRLPATIRAWVTPND